MGQFCQQSPSAFFPLG